MPETVPPVIQEGSFDVSGIEAGYMRLIELATKYGDIASKVLGGGGSSPDSKKSIDDVASALQSLNKNVETITKGIASSFDDAASRIENSMLAVIEKVSQAYEALNNKAKTGAPDANKQGGSAATPVVPTNALLEVEKILERIGQSTGLDKVINELLQFSDKFGVSFPNAANLANRALEVLTDTSGTLEQRLNRVLNAQKELTRTAEAIKQSVATKRKELLTKIDERNALVDPADAQKAKDLSQEIEGLRLQINTLGVDQAVAQNSAKALGTQYQELAQEVSAAGQKIEKTATGGVAVVTPSKTGANQAALAQAQAELAAAQARNVAASASSAAAIDKVRMAQDALTQATKNRTAAETRLAALPTNASASEIKTATDEVTSAINRQTAAQQTLQNATVAQTAATNQAATAQAAFAQSQSNLAAAQTKAGSTGNLDPVIKAQNELTQATQKRIAAEQRLTDIAGTATPAEEKAAVDALTASINQETAARNNLNKAVNQAATDRANLANEAAKLATAQQRNQAAQLAAQSLTLDQKAQQAVNNRMLAETNARNAATGSIKEQISARKALVSALDKESGALEGVAKKHEAGSKDILKSHDKLLILLGVSRLLPGVLGKIASGAALMSGSLGSSEGKWLALGGTATSVITNVVHKMFEWTNQFNELTNKQRAQKEGLGLSLLEVKAFDFVLKQTDGSIENFAVGVKKINEAIVGVGEEVEKTRSVLKLAFAGTSFAIEGKSPKEIVLELAKNIQRLEEAGVAGALAAQIFGRSWDEVKGRLRDLAEQEAAAEKAIEKTGVSSKEAEDRAKAYAQSMAELGLAWERVASKLAVPITAIINLVSKIIAPQMEDPAWMKPGLDSLPDEAKGKAYQEADKLQKLIISFYKDVLNNPEAARTTKAEIDNLIKNSPFSAMLADLRTYMAARMALLNDKDLDQSQQTKLKEAATDSKEKIRAAGASVLLAGVDLLLSQEAKKKSFEASDAENAKVQELMKGARIGEKEASARELEKSRIDVELQQISEKIGKKRDIIKRQREFLNDSNRSKKLDAAARVDAEKELATTIAATQVLEIEKMRLQQRLHKLGSGDDEARRLFEEQLEAAQESRRDLIPGSSRERAAEGRIEKLLSARIATLRAKYEGGDESALAELTQREKSLNAQRRKSRGEMIAQMFSEHERMLEDTRTAVEQTLEKLDTQRALATLQIEQLGERGVIPFREVIGEQIRLINAAFLEYKALRTTIIKNLDTETAIVNGMLAGQRISPVEGENRLRSLQKQRNQQTLDISKQGEKAEQEINERLLSSRQDYISRRELLLNLEIELQRSFATRKLELLQAGARDSLLIERAGVEAEFALQQKTSEDRLTALQSRFRDVRKLFVEQQAGGVTLTLPDILSSTNLDEIRNTLEFLSNSPTELSQQLFEILKGITEELSKQGDISQNRLLKLLDLQTRDEQKNLDIKKQQLELANAIFSAEEERARFLNSNNLLNKPDQLKLEVALEERKLSLFKEQSKSLREQTDAVLKRLVRERAASGQLNPSTLAEVLKFPELANLNRDFVELVEKTRESSITVDLLTSRLGQFRTGMSEIVQQVSSLPEPFNQLRGVFEGLQHLADVLLQNRTARQTPAQELQQASRDFSDYVGRSAKAFYDEAQRAGNLSDQKSGQALDLLKDVITKLDASITSGNAKFAPFVSSEMRSVVDEFRASLKSATPAVTESLLRTSDSVSARLDAFGTEVESKLRVGVIEPLDGLKTPFDKLAKAVDDLSARIGAAAQPFGIKPGETADAYKARRLAEEGLTGYAAGSGPHTGAGATAESNTPKRSRGRKTVTKPVESQGFSTRLQGFTFEPAKPSQVPEIPPIAPDIVQMFIELLPVRVQRFIDDLEASLPEKLPEPAKKNVSTNATKIITSAGKFLTGIANFAGNLFSGLSSGSVGGKISGIGGAIGSLGSFFKAGSGLAKGLPIVGAIAEIAGGIFDFVGGVFKAKAQKIANGIQEDFQGIMNKFKAGSLTLGQTITSLQGELLKARAALTSGKIGKKGGAAQFQEIEKQINQQIEELKLQAKNLQEGFIRDLDILRLPENLRSMTTSITAAFDKMQEYLRSFEDPAEALKHLGDAQQYLSLTLKDLKDNAIDQLDAIIKREEDAEAQFKSSRDAIINQGRVQTGFEDAQDRLAQLFELEKKRAEERAQALSDEAKIEQQISVVDEAFAKSDKVIDKMARVFNDLSAQLGAIFQPGGFLRESGGGSSGGGGTTNNIGSLSLSITIPGSNNPQATGAHVADAVTQRFVDMGLVNPVTNRLPSLAAGRPFK